MFLAPQRNIRGNMQYNKTLKTSRIWFNVVSIFMMVVSFLPAIMLVLITVLIIAGAISSGSFSDGDGWAIVIVMLFGVGAIALLPPGIVTVVFFALSKKQIKKSQNALDLFSSFKALRLSVIFQIPVSGLMIYSALSSMGIVLETIFEDAGDSPELILLMIFVAITLFALAACSLVPTILALREVNRSKPVYLQPNQPVYQQPIYQQPVYQQPTIQQPVYQQPMDQQLTIQQPVYQQPMNQQSTIQQPVVQQPTDGQPY